MSASLQFLSLSPKTLSLHHNSSSSVAAAPCFFNLKPLPKFVLSISSVNSYALSASKFVRRVAYTSDLEESFSETEEAEDEQSFSPDLKLFVGNLPFNVDSAALAGLFEQVGTVEMVEVIYDKETGRSRGFGFVTMSSAEEVRAAENQYNGYELQGRAIRVNSGPAPPKSENSFGGQRDNSSFRGGRDNSSFRGGRDNSSFRGGSRDDYRGGSRDSSSFRGGSRDDFRGGSRDSSSFRGGSRGEGSFDNSNRVYVGNLSWGVDNLALETLFSEQGRVKEAKVVYDRESGRSRGFGFVTFGSPQEVSKAVEKLDGMDLDGRSIRVSPAEERQRPQF